MIDHNKVLFSSEWNAYKNINVYSTTVNITAGSFTGVVNFDRTITVEPGTRFAFVKVQCSSFDSPSVYRWSMLGQGAYKVYRTLSVDPTGSGVLDLWWGMIISGNNVTFRLSGRNPYGSAHAFNAISLGVEYATFTTEN